MDGSGRALNESMNRLLPILFLCCAATLSPKQRQLAKESGAPLLVGPATNKVDSVIASVLSGNILTQYHGLVTQSNLNSLIVINVTNPPAPTRANVAVTWTEPRTILYSSDLAAFNVSNITATCSVVMPPGSMGFVRTPVAPMTVVLSFDPSPTPTVVGYLCEYGPASFVYTNTVDIGTNTIFALNSFAPGQTCYYVVLAVDGTGQLSVPSNEVSYTTPLPAPAQIKIY